MISKKEINKSCSRNYFIIYSIPGKSVQETLPVVEKVFERSEETILIDCDTTSREISVFHDPDIDIESLSLEQITYGNIDHTDESCRHVLMVIRHGKASLFKTTETTHSTVEKLLKVLSKGLSKRFIKSLDHLHNCDTHLAGEGPFECNTCTTELQQNKSVRRKRPGNTIPVPAEPDHPVKKQRLTNDENVLSLKRYKRRRDASVKNMKKTYSFKDKNLQNSETTVIASISNSIASEAEAPFRNITNIDQRKQATYVAKSDQEKTEVEKKKKLGVKYLRKVCSKVKKKYVKKKIKTKTLTKVIRKLTDLPGSVYHHVRLTVFPAKRSGKSGRNRNQNSASQRPAPQVPIQATDATERDRNRPLVTSTTPVFSAGGPGPSTSTMPTTSLMDFDNERTLRERLRGAGSQVQVAPRYPEYENQSVRQRSFANWPSYTQQQSARLIIFGFYYTGQADLVRCFQCGIGLKDWSPGDEPLFEHVRHSPRCPFLQQLLGDELLGTYRDNLAEAQQRNETATSHGLNIQAPQARPRNVRHPDRSTMSQRLASFTNWPQTNGQPPHRLAEAGLFYTGMNDLCRCFTCDGGLQRWDKDDDPWLEHARWFPHCTYVREVKGQDYINLVLAAAEQAMREDEDSVVIQGLSSRDLQTTDPMTTEEARSVLDMGYSKAAVQLAIHEYNGKNPTKGALSFSAADLVQILIGRQERGEEIPQDLPSEELGATGSSEPRAAADPIVENRRLKGILKCLKCQENDCNMLLLPCTHHRLCEACAENVTHCPVCGRKVEDKVRTFMS